MVTGPLYLPRITRNGYNMSFSLIGDVRCLRNSSPASVHRVLEPADTRIDVVSCAVPFLTALHHVSHSLTCTACFAMRTRPACAGCTTSSAGVDCRANGCCAQVPNLVAVPTHFFKVVLADSKSRNMLGAKQARAHAFEYIKQADCPLVLGDELSGLMRQHMVCPSCHQQTRTALRAP